MAQLHHSTVRFTAHSDTHSSVSNALQTAFVEDTPVPALITANLLNPVSSEFADLINNNLPARDTALRVVIEEKALAVNPDLQARIDSYFAAHPWLNYFSCVACSLNELGAHVDTGPDQFYLFFGGQSFLATSHESPIANISIATQTVGETMADFDLLVNSLQLRDKSLSCVCFDSKLIISDRQYNRASWVVRGIQHALFNDSQMYHWIEGNLYQLFSADRTAIDQLFSMVFTPLFTGEDTMHTGSPLGVLVDNLEHDKTALLNIGLSGYAQTITAMMMLSVRYAIEVGTIEEGADARLLHLLKQIVWIAASHARMMQGTPTIDTMPVLIALGSYEVQKVDVCAMRAARHWLTARLHESQRVA